ncbi:MAG: adenylate/guanylate cyclase domain-containing protein [Candidatus Sedimenticola endophacoides]|uniref:Adenylate/guanylate cyclase domain-containing protein n=1 Tax=Candidatus Sedimenticola endophacoides TaxID=2548426 RepID=A0A6N4DJK2_9GAMM|nr:MAG: adenylate/guanylate cyclase domain-containing protein [Candidatus Sedimenticola endophacoides]
MQCAGRSRDERRTVGAVTAVALASRFWGLGCPKIFHEVATLLYLAGRGVPRPLLGNLAGPALYTLVEVLLEGVEFFSAPHHQAYWVFALAVGVLQQLRLGSPAQHWARILLVSENLVRTSILLVLYVILEHQLGAYDSVWQFFEERSHIYVALVIPVIGVVVGFSQWTAHSHLQGVLATSALLQRYSEWFLGRELLERAVADPHSLALKRRNRALLFLDIRGFTAWSERHEPEQVVTLINRFYQCAEPFWRRAQAIKVKLSADEIMLVFADPEGAAEAARAVMAACERLLRHEGLRCGAGLHWGAVVEGMIGARGHQGYDLLGDAVNTAKRLCDAAAGGEILVSGRACERLGRRFRLSPARQLRLKGKHGGQVVRALVWDPQPVGGRGADQLKSSSGVSYGSGYSLRSREV